MIDYMHDFFFCRHPSVLRFIAEVESGGVLYMVTEDATPLNLLDKETLGGPETSLPWGCKNILKGIAFLADIKVICLFQIMNRGGGESAVAG